MTMITAKEAYQIAKNYLMERGRDYAKLEDEDEYSPKLRGKAKILYGKKKGEIDDVWVVSYDDDSGYDPIGYFITISATTGTVHFTIGPSSVVEEYEDAGFQ